VSVPRVLEFSRRAPGWSRPHVAWWTFCSMLTLIYFKLVHRIRLEGREHVAPTGPMIYASNHQSHFDPCIVGLLTRDRLLSAIARASLFGHPIAAWLFRSLGGIPIERGGTSGRAALEAAIGELEAGRTVLIYPEGTRSTDGRVGAFNKGIMLLARRSRVPIVPIALEGASDVWPKGAGRPRFGGRIAARAAEPIDPETFLAGDADASLESLRRTIETMRLELRAELRTASGGRFPVAGPADRPYWESPEADDGADEAA